MWMVGEVFERDAAQTVLWVATKGDGIDTNLDSVLIFHCGTFR